ncbi:hypothetical protein PL418_01160 [Barnesiella intestinihominis]|uniref:hypothetical protein n=1 Tax=Barnesiella intestinihominis TaxID=487174 RepID=UPI00189A1E32|nr:hypothetical protein [Barnesiella intestinihominis]MDB0680183.1 hypothetical protein [Barnesiella intestinihominis]
MGKLELVIESENISIYSPKFDGETMTEFEKFMFINRDLSYPQLKRDFDAIISVIKKMADDCGARENLFRLEGGNIKAIPLCICRRSRSVGTLRLYCIRISDKILVIGNGGIKRTKTFQEDPALLGIVNQLRQIEHRIFVESKKARVDYCDFDKMKPIIETITI